jgi:hypothetical protein
MLGRALSLHHVSAESTINHPLRPMDSGLLPSVWRTGGCVGLSV